MDKSLPIDTYEARPSKYARRTRGSHSRAQDELILSRHDRETLLIEWGVTFNEMIDAIRTNVKIKNQRRRTVNAIGTYDRIEEIMENTASKLKGKLKLKKNTGSTGNGTVAAASHNHGAAVVPTPRTNIVSSNQRPSKRKQRTLLHSNQMTPTTAGAVNEQHSIRSNNSSDSSAFGGSGSDKVSNSTTTSTSNIAVCFDEMDYKHRLGKDPTETVSVDAMSEVNDFSTNVRTPASSIIETSQIKNNCDDTNPVTVGDTGNQDNNDVTNDTDKISNNTLYDLDDEIEKELALVATDKKQQKKHRSSSFDDRRHNMNVNENSIIPLRPQMGTSSKVVLEPIIGVDIPRDLKLQRSMSVESGLTYDVHLMHAENNYDYGTVQQQMDDDVSTLAYDFEHDIVDHQDGIEQEETDHDPSNSEDNETIPSKFLREFNELMMDDGHPNLLNKTINHLDEDLRNNPTSNAPRTLPIDTQRQQHATIDMSHENAHHRFSPECPSYNDSPQPLHANTYFTVGDDRNDDDENNNVDVHTAKSLMTEDEYNEVYLQVMEHPLSPISELTGMDRFHNSFNSRSTSSSYVYRKLHPEDGDFDILQRDSSFWGICPGEHDAPQIRRMMMPVVITEDASVGQSVMQYFETQPSELSRITEGQHYAPNSEEFRYQTDNDVYDSSTYPNMMLSKRIMFSSQLDENMALQTQYALPTVLQPLNTVSGISPPNLMNSPHVGLVHPHQQHDYSMNNTMLHHHSPNAHYPTPHYAPPQLVMPSSGYPMMTPTPVESFVPPELMYNIENGQYQCALNDHHANMYVYDTETVDVADTEQWDEYGFRMEPPPNSSTLLHKMMM